MKYDIKRQYWRAIMLFRVRAPSAQDTAGYHRGHFTIDTGPR